jgi:PIN domain nuclease of toxin-antitoxin system
LLGNGGVAAVALLPVSCSGSSRPPLPGSYFETVERLGFRLLPITGAHAEHAAGLPRHHNDPFDRLIIAQAYLEGMVLDTQDPAMRVYGVTTLGLDAR